MKKIIVPKLLVVALLSTVAFGCANNGNQPDKSGSVSTVNEKSTELEKVGYSLGYMMADGNKDMVDDLNLDAFELGFRDAYAGKDASLTDEQMKEVISSYQEKKQIEMMEKLQEQAKINKEKGDKFLAENAKKDGVKTTESGLQFKVIKEGTGKAVSEKDIVSLNYEGKLIDGTVFDSSYKRGQPAIFAVQQVVPGFSEGLTLMKEGGEYELYIPADLAYGEAGAEGMEPNSTLIFKVEILEVNPKMPEQHAQ